jgi:hypothetical protein
VSLALVTSESRGACKLHIGGELASHSVPPLRSLFSRDVHYSIVIEPQSNFILGRLEYEFSNRRQGKQKSEYKRIRRRVDVDSRF